ncbi:MAG: hypothetical protein CTY18_05680 [Methylomonas sp.]|nr:MAG: hypothetical protein CTY18_05680 [Methylomonas sp.]
MKSEQNLQNLKVLRAQAVKIKINKSFLASCYRFVQNPGYHIKKLCQRLSLHRKKVVLKKQFNEKKLELHSNDRIFACIRITGGIGDVVCITRWVAQLKHSFGEALVIDIFFVSPEIADFILEAAGVRNVFSDLIFRRVSPLYDICMLVNQFVTINWSYCKVEHICSINPGLLAFAAKVETSLMPYRKYIDLHPALDGLFADQAVKQNLNRKDFLSLMSGFDSPSPYLNIKLPDNGLLIKYGLIPKKYITIHDGWDKNFKLTDYNVRPTKSYPSKYFITIIELIKNAYPEIKIVQLGGNVGSNIMGVDINLRGKLNLDCSAFILKSSLCHIDTESGLVHLATSLGVKCVVIFGPTNYEFYAYERNQNIIPDICGNCMWVTDSWMEKCPIGYFSAKCTDSTKPEKVFKAVSKVLEEKV